MYPHQNESRYISPSSPGGSEPMTLGSPVSSPTRNGHTNVNYLPPLLIRDPGIHNSPSSPPMGAWSTPSGKTPHQSSFIHSQISPVASRKALFHSPAISHSYASSPMTHQVLNSPSVVKPVGPPVQGLFDSIITTPTEALKYTKMDDALGTPMHGTPGTPLSAFRTQDRSQLNGVLTPNRSFNPNASPAQIDPFYTQGESLMSSEQLDESWITIFGFPISATNFVLEQFSHYGKITERKLETPGNWIHIKYQSKLQAKKALSKNGKIFASSIMVGVKPCIEMNIMSESIKENSEVDVSNTTCEEPLDLESLDSSRRSLKNIRPLTQIYSSPAAAAEGAPSPKIQRKANGLVSKAIEYVLKW